MFKIVLYICLCVLLTSCFKTAEEIKREQMVDQMSVQLEQSSKLVAELTQQVNYLQSKLDSKFGDLEEKQHIEKSAETQKAETFMQTTSQIAAQVVALQNEVEQNKKTIASLETQLNSQKKYISKVNTALGGIAGSSSGDKLKDAHTLFEKNQLGDAMKAYEDVLAENKINAAQKNHVYYNMGLIHYRNKKYDDALVLFSKIYTKYPTSSWAPRSLLFIARSFEKQGKKAEAKATYQELLKKYAKSAQAKSAQDEINKL